MSPGRLRRDSGDMATPVAAHVLQRRHFRFCNHLGLAARTLGARRSPRFWHLVRPYNL